MCSTSFGAANTKNHSNSHPTTQYDKVPFAYLVADYHTRDLLQLDVVRAILTRQLDFHNRTTPRHAGR